MKTENVQLSIPRALLIEAQQATSMQHVSVDELMREAVKPYLD